MNQNDLIEVSMYELLSRYNIVVPEIQREYVWGANSELLNKFFTNIIADYSSDTTKKTEALDTLKKNLDESKVAPDEAIMQYYSSKYTNIGFLYSYRPFYQSNTSSSKEDLYLIDGQQRFTTLFLMLIVTAKMAGDALYKEFCDLWYNPEGEGVSFDYKVRDLTHDFLIRLLANYTGEDFSKTVFYHKTDAADPSIKNMILTLNEWKKCLEQKKLKSNSIEGYYHFLLNDVRFWHFKTEKTSQGEELYITMNARGCRLAKNETARAEMNMDPEQSKKWEGVKDFFWKHRYERRDEEWGMNEFCTWLEILFDKTREENWEKCFEAVSTICENGFFVDSSESNDKYPCRFLYAKSSPESGSKNELSKIDRFQILPVLSWYIKFVDTLNVLDSSIRSKRMGDIIAFFKRVSKYNSISKSIDDALKPALCMISKMVNCDIATICNNFDFSDCRAMFFPEELFKFHLYLFPPSETGRATVEGILSDLSSISQGQSLEVYFEIAGNHNFQFPFANKDIFWKKLCKLRDSMQKLKSEFDNNSLIFYGNFIPELYEETFGDNDQVWLRRNENWPQDKDLLSFVEKYLVEKYTDGLNTCIDQKDLLREALISKAKDFINKLGNDLTKVSSAKEQLYLYFIYLLYIEKGDINRLYPNGKMNFYSNSDTSAECPDDIFEIHYGFVIFNKYTPSYRNAENAPIHRIPIQQQLQLENNNWLQKLQCWAKDCDSSCHPEPQIS